MNEDLLQFKQEIDMLEATLDLDAVFDPSQARQVFRCAVTQALKQNLIPRGFRVITPDDIGLHYALIIAPSAAMAHVVDCDDQIVNLSRTFNQEFGVVVRIDSFDKLQAFLGRVISTQRLDPLP